MLHSSNNPLIDSNKADTIENARRVTEFVAATLEPGQEVLEGQRLTLLVAVHALEHANTPTT